MGGIFLDKNWKTKKISLVELGPGNGIFCKTFCKILENFQSLNLP